jgi:hypothetical protein
VNLLALLVFSACTETPVSSVPFDDRPEFALSADVRAGDRVRTIRWTQVFPNDSATVESGRQAPNVEGTVVSGPVTVGNQPRWQVDYDTGADGWSLGSSLEAEPGSVIASVTVLPETVSVAAGDTARVTAVARDSAGAPVDQTTVDWSTVNPATAIVTEDGLVQGIAPDTTAVIAAAGAAADTAVVVVEDTVESAAVASISLELPADSMDIGGTVQATATLRDANGAELTDRPVIWTSSDTTRATVDGTGLVSGVATGPVIITASSEGQVDSATVTVRQAAVGGGMLFSSSWSTATGNSVRALFDSAGRTPWNMRIGNGRMNEVVPATGLDFPTQNALAVRAGYRSGGGAQAENIRLHEGLPELGVGHSRFYRWYIRVVVPDGYTSDNSTHPIQDGTNGSVTNWMFQVEAGQGSWTLGWSVGGSRQNPWPNNRWLCPATLLKGRTYRVELKVTRTGAGSMTFEPRVYDAAGSMVCGESDFANVNRTATLAGRPELVIANPAWLRSIQVGFNGLNQGVESDFPLTLFYQGAVCVRSDTWCGAYSQSEQ